MAIDVKKSMQEFESLKLDNRERNLEYFLLRKAYRGTFRWPTKWPTHIERLTRNFCGTIVDRHTTYLMGKGFTFNVDRPNTLEYRQHAECAEKILHRLFDLSSSDVQFIEGAKIGSKLGRTIFKVWKKGEDGHQHAAFSYCQPDYFFGIPIGPDSPGEFSKVFYSYPVDRDEAVRRYGNHPYKGEEEGATQHYDIRTEEQGRRGQVEQERRVPVVEIWTPENYALIVGGVTIYNGNTPDEYRWKDSKKGFIPFIVIENARNDEDGYGTADIAETRLLNEQYNYLFSRRQHIVNRWCTPTVTWEGAPQNAASIIADTVEGGGLIPMRLGSRIGLLTYDKPNPAVQEQLTELRTAMIETAGLNEVSYQGLSNSSFNTGPAMAAQYQPMLATVEKKRKEWSTGIPLLCAMLLNVQESIKKTDVLGEAVINATTKSQSAIPNGDPAAAAQGITNYSDNPDGDLVMLNGDMIAGLRRVTISWPGILPKDDVQAAQLELQKTQQGLQSFYTTLEKLGEEYPDDEIARIRMENQDPALRGEKVAEQMKAATPLINQQSKNQHEASLQAMKMAADMQMQQQQQAPPAPEFLDQGPPPDQGGDLGSRLREAAKMQQIQMNDQGNFPVLEPAANSMGQG